MNTVVLNLEPIAHLSDEQFYQLCIANRDLSLEMKQPRASAPETVSYFSSSEQTQEAVPLKPIPYTCKLITCLISQVHQQV